MSLVAGVSDEGALVYQNPSDVRHDIWTHTVDPFHRGIIVG